MKRKKLILNALILTISTVSLGFISMGFRVYLSNKIGPEGMGLYQIIMSINFMAATLAISGIRVTITRLVAEELGKNSNARNLKSLIFKGCIYSLLFSITTAILLYNNAEFISVAWIKDTRAINPLKILSFGLPFTSLTSCICGYFYGARKVIKSVTTDVLESLSMMTIIIVSISTVLGNGLEAICCLIAIGMICGNILSAIYSYTLYIFEKKRPLRRNTNQSFKLFDVASIALPIAFSAYIQNALKTVEDILIPNALRAFSSSNSTSLSIFGIIKGMVLPILGFPAIFLASFSTLIIPEISEANALHKQKLVVYIISKVFKFTLLIAVFASGLFFIYSNELGLALYNNNQAGVLMRILSPLIPMMYLDRIVDGSLNALDEQMSTLKYNLIDMSVRIFLILYLIPKSGIEGFIIVLFVSTALNSSLSINKLLKVTNLNFKFLDWLFKPAFCITISSYLVKYIFNTLKVSLILEILCIVFIYFICLILVGCIKKKDIMWFVDAFKTEKIDLTQICIYKEF
jgi:stage V sporulation protein B